VRQPDARATVENSVYGAEAQDLGFGPTGGGAVEIGTDLAQDRIVPKRRFCGQFTFVGSHIPTNRQCAHRRAPFGKSCRGWWLTAARLPKPTTSRLH
jgi:hypothetical protein